MFKSKNIILYEILGLLAIFTIIYFIAVNKASYAFAYDETEELYNSKIFLIRKSAEEYANNNEDLFSEKETVYITVDDLVKNGYLVGDDKGIISDPRSTVKTLNDIKIRLTHNDEKISVKVLS